MNSQWTPEVTKDPVRITVFGLTGCDGGEEDRAVGGNMLRAENYVSADFPPKF